MDTIFVLFCVGCVTVVSAVSNFKLTDCTGNTPNRLFRFNSVSLDPPVIHIPGNETGSLDVEILRNISGDHFKLDVSIKKHILFAYVEIPCIRGIGLLGSCTHSNLCDLFTQFLDKNGRAQCPHILQQNNFPCTCPFRPGHYNINPVTFKINPLKGIYSLFFTPGDFKASAKLTDKRTGEQVGCFNIEVSVREPTTGFLLA